ncbi:CYTH domain-containing protein [Candidatus Woesearchaeota archaeon]|nr:CYTH domain-containing protein [Candidatus Woesearchaeota archaeon]
MKETEIKILEIDKESIEAKIKELSGKKVFDDEIHTTIFDFEDNYLKKNKSLLRLRKEGNEHYLVFKKNEQKKELKTADEIHVKIDDFNKTKTILNNIGLFVVEENRKHRTSYKIEDVRFDIDEFKKEYSHIPAFLEIESNNIGNIYRYAEKLGFKKEDCRPWNFFDLKKYYS